METKEIYAAPIVEVIEVEVEKGFAVTGYGNDTEGNHNFGGRN